MRILEQVMQGIELRVSGTEGIIVFSEYCPLEVRKIMVERARQVVSRLSPVTGRMIGTFLHRPNKDDLQKQMDKDLGIAPDSIIMEGDDMRVRFSWVNGMMIVGDLNVPSSRKKYLTKHRSRKDSNA